MAGAAGLGEGAAQWLLGLCPALRLPLAARRPGGGNSNLTFVITDADGRRVVVRRPPPGNRPDSAHDVLREFAIISALAGTAVPVPRAIGQSTDPQVSSAPIVALGWVDGIVVRTQSDAGMLPATARRLVSQNLARTLASIHAVDLDSAGLGWMRRDRGYVDRQVGQWRRQLAAWGSAAAQQLERTGDRLARRPPAEADARVLHGDYRLDNCIIDRQGRIRAVLDWELSAAGPPLADLGMLYAYWEFRSNHDELGLPSAPTLAEGFLTADEIVLAYREASGAAVDDLDFYLALAHWKIACITYSVLVRRSGAADPADGWDAAARDELADAITASERAAEGI